MEGQILRDDFECYQPVIVDDLLSGINDWHNTQEIVRLTFKALSDVVRAQGSAVRELEAQLDSRPSWMEVQKALDQKVNYQDMQRFQIKEGYFEEVLDEKMSIKDVQSLVGRKIEQLKQSFVDPIEQKVLDLEHSYGGKLKQVDQVLQGKVGFDQFSEALEGKANFDTVQRALQGKVDRVELEGFFQQKVSASSMEIMDQKIDAQVANRKFEQIEKKLQSIDWKADFDKLYNNFRDFRRDMQSILDKKIYELEVEQQKIWDKIESYNKDENSTYEIQELQLKIEKLKEDQERQIQKLGINLQKNHTDRSQELLIQQVNKIDQKVKMQYQLIKDNQDVKYLSEQVSMLQQQYQRLNQVQDQLRQENQGEILIKSIQNQLDQLKDNIFQVQHCPEQIESFKQYFNNQLDSLQSDWRQQKYMNDTAKLTDQFYQLDKKLQQKANLQDIYKILHTKLDSNEFHDQINELRSTIRSFHEFSNFIEEQSIINEALCGENCLSRWIWKSGNLSLGNQIPWEVQSVNTCPDNFIWEKGSTSIITVAPGLYEINIGIYCREQIELEVLINGEHAIKLEGLQENKKIFRHSAGNVAGYSLFDFIALPARARISVSTSTSTNIEGFLGMRKL